MRFEIRILPMIAILSILFFERIRSYPPLLPTVLLPRRSVTRNKYNKQEYSYLVINQHFTILRQQCGIVGPFDNLDITI